MDSVVHFELPVDSVEKATEFYSKAFGWKVNKAPGDDMDYWIVHTGAVDDKFMLKEKGMINGGIYKRGPGGSKSSVVVISVGDLDKSIDKVKKNGGEVVLDKRQVGEMGYYAQVKDTQDNILGLWQDVKKK